MTKIPALHPTIRAWLLEARSGVRHAAQARRLCDQPENTVIMKTGEERRTCRRARFSAAPGARHVETSHNWGLFIMAECSRANSEFCKLEIAKTYWH